MSEDDNWQGLEAAYEKIKGFRPFPLAAPDAVNVRGLTTYEGQTFIMTDSGLYRVDGDKLVKVEPTPEEISVNLNKFYSGQMDPWPVWKE